MKTKYMILPLVALGIAVTSCKDDMDYHEYSIVDKDFIEKNFGNVGGFMTDLYNTVEYDFGNFSSGAMQAAATDEAEYSKIGNSIEDFYNGGWTPTNAKSTNWTNMYTGIQSANHYIDFFQGLKFEDYELNPDYAQQMYRYENYVYEARFLRAYYYFVLVRQYGGVPLIDHQMAAGEVNTMSRNTSDEIYEFIIKECDEIKDKIIRNYADLGSMALGQTESGRAGKIAVLALRARAALYWASPLFNPNGDKERYKKAADYYKDLFDECQYQGKGLTAKYSNLWDANSFNDPAIDKELLFCRRYYKSASGDNLVETNNYPVGIEGGTGGTCPTQNLVDAYDMLNGKSINEAGSGYDPKNPYANRDPRLAATVAVNGDVWPSYQKNKLQTYYGGTNGQPLSGATTTGYYLKKLCNGAIDLSASSKYKESRHTYLNFRYGGALLDYAEAVYQYTGSADVTLPGHTMTARQAVNQVRNRAGMPDVTETGDAFWTKYQNERFVELAFEGHRFWDVRRWKEGKKFFTTITRMNITKNADGSFTYNPQQVSRQWDERNNLFPIPQTEISKNGNLVQNPGW
ncbi:MAG: RagB/SusD family nutrient uptake outer membrane protein [Muribaculaceae bacterium]|nr:RagB/SusD family nutrient uptake outer membrane protein [Muribaculaceae bacterium]